jgi:thiol-disulfide isomerase/thioredoxin
LFVFRYDYISFACNTPDSVLNSAYRIGVFMNRRSVLRTATAGLFVTACGTNRSSASQVEQVAAANGATSPGIAAPKVVQPNAPAMAAGTVLPLMDGPPAPELIGGGEWVNSEPLTLAGLRGTVVLIDFWTYGCYNCRNTFPAMRAWWKEFQPQGLVIIGVHTPEFAAEHKIENVREAVIREDIGWPIVQDNDYAIWQAYRNRYWPRFYVVSRSGKIIYDHIGEGAYELTAQNISKALAEQF